MDDLTQIKGIGKATAARLVDAGIASFAALAAALPEQFNAIDKLGGKPAEWLGWVEQAKALLPAPVNLEKATPDQVDDHAARIDAARTKLDEAGKAAAAAAVDRSPEAYEAARQAVLDAQAELDRLIGEGTLSKEESFGQTTQPAEATTSPSTDSTHTTPESEADQGEAGDLAAGLPDGEFDLATAFGPAVAALENRVMALFTDVSPEAAAEYLAEQLSRVDAILFHPTKMRAEILRLDQVVKRAHSVWPLVVIRFDGVEQPVGVELKVDHDTFQALTGSGAATDHPPEAESGDVQ